MGEKAESTIKLKELLTACNITAEHLRKSGNVSEAELNALMQDEPLSEETTIKIERVLYTRPSYMQGNNVPKSERGWGM